VPHPHFGRLHKCCQRKCGDDERRLDRKPLDWVVQFVQEVGDIDEGYPELDRKPLDWVVQFVQEVGDIDEGYPENGVLESSNVLVCAWGHKDRTNKKCKS